MTATSSHNGSSVSPSGLSSLNGGGSLDLLVPELAADLDEVERLLTRSLRPRYSVPLLARVLDHVRHYRGKRLRPVLLMLSARACGQITFAHPILGAVVEMVHTATLVHDDVLDNANLRRRVATVNALWGTQTSVLLGDYLFTHAFHLASTVGDAEACRMIGEATNQVCEGELCQVLQRGNVDLSEEDYFAIIDGKTAALTACSCQLGAHYAGSTPETVEALRRFGQLVGQAFQIADDLLDLIGEEKATGKSLGTDLEQGKLTLPLIHLLQTASSTIKDRAHEVISAKGAVQREQLVGLLKANGSLEYAQKRAFSLVEQARTELMQLSPSPSRSALEAMALRAVCRQG